MVIIVCINIMEKNDLLESKCIAKRIEDKLFKLIKK